MNNYNLSIVFARLYNNKKISNVYSNNSKYNNNNKITGLFKIVSHSKIVLMRLLSLAQILVRFNIRAT